MKHIKLFILFLSAAFLITACKVEETVDWFQSLDNYVKVKVDIYDVSFDRHGKSRTVGSEAILLLITPTDEEIDLSVSEPWCHAEIFKDNDKTYLAITSDPNKDETRTAKVSIMAGKGAEKSGAIINVSQETANIVPNVEVNFPTIVFDKYGGQETLSITTNLENWDFKVTNSSGGTEWFQLERIENKLVITASDAGAIELREVEILITAVEDEFDASTIVTITQDKARKTLGGIELMFVEGGNFLMGSNLGDLGYVALTNVVSNSPKHSVTLTEYYIGKFEVTQKQYFDIMGTNPSRYPWATYTGSNNDKYDPNRPETLMYADYPVEMTTWTMAMQFCEKLNEIYGDQGTFSLPTEAQWEYAARGGKYMNELNRLLYAGSDNISLVARPGNGAGTEKISRPDPVGRHQPNELGIYDMSGNVLEYVYDYFAPYPSEHVTDPTGPTQPTTTGIIGKGYHHVIRGGSHWHRPSNTAWTVYARGGNTNENYTGNGFTGFRVAFKRKAQ